MILHGFQKPRNQCYAFKNQHYGLFVPFWPSKPSKTSIWACPGLQILLFSLFWLLFFPLPCFFLKKKEIWLKKPGDGSTPIGNAKKNTRKVKTKAKKVTVLLPLYFNEKTCLLSFFSVYALNYQLLILFVLFDALFFYQGIAFDSLIDALFPCCWWGSGFLGVWSGIFLFVHPTSWHLFVLPFDTCLWVRVCFVLSFWHISCVLPF